MQVIVFNAHIVTDKCVLDYTLIINKNQHINIIHRSLSGATEIVHPVSMRRRSIQPGRVQVNLALVLLNDYVSFDIELAILLVCGNLNGDLV